MKFSTNKFNWNRSTRRLHKITALYTFACSFRNLYLLLFSRYTFRRLQCIEFAYEFKTKIFRESKPTISWFENYNNSFSKNWKRGQYIILTERSLFLRKKIEIENKRPNFYRKQNWKFASIKIEQFSRNKMKYRRNQTINNDKTLLNNNLKSQKWCAWEIDNYTLNNKQWFLKLSEISIFQINVLSIMQFSDELRWTKILRESKTIVSWMIEKLQFELIYLDADNNFHSKIWNFSKNKNAANR